MLELYTLCESMCIVLYCHRSIENIFSRIEELHGKHHSQITSRRARMNENNKTARAVYGKEKNQTRVRHNRNVCETTRDRER